MKHAAKRLFKSCVSLLLVLCMVCSLSLTALAADSTPAPGVSGVSDVTGDGIITYVSFGDSVTNGYGMEEYRFSDGTNVLGFRQEVSAAYPALIRDYLSNQGFTVNLEQMAISGFRMDELHWMLCDDYEADSYHNYQFADWNRIAVRRLLRSTNEEAKISADELRSKYLSVFGSDDGMIANADSVIMAEYRSAVENADLITIDLGTNNFGTFVTNTIQEILGLKDLAYEVDFSQYVDAKTAASLDAMLGQMVAGMLGTDSGKSYDLAMTLARCLMYGYLGYTEHFDGAIEAVYKINPKAKVVVIDCYSMINGVELAGGALGENIDLDALYGMFIDLANFYSRELSPYANMVTHATLDSAPELFIDYYKDYPDSNYPESQYMYPTAERLMNEFVMENMGYDPDEPAEREQFNQKILAPIQMLDGYVNNLNATIKSEVIDAQITPQLNSIVGDLEKQIDTTITAIELIHTAVEGVATAKGMLPTAMEGVEAARNAVDASSEGVAAAEAAVDEAIAGVNTAKNAVQTAVEGVATAEAAVDTAVQGIALAQGIVDLLVENLIGNSMFKGSETSSFVKSIILDTIEGYITDELMVQAGFEVTDANRAALAEEAYRMGCIYYDEQKVNNGTQESANKLAVLEGVRYMLVAAKGYSEEDAQATAQTAWALNAINNSEGYDAAVLAALKTEVDEATAVLAIQINAVYEMQGEEAAIKAAIATQVTDEMLAQFGLSDKNEAAGLIHQLGTLGAANKSAAVKQAIALKITDEMLAQLGLTDKDEAAVLVYELGTLAKTDYRSAVIKAMTLKVDQATAELAYAMVEAYEADGENAAIMVAVAASLTDENMAALAAFGITDRSTAAELICQVAALYNETYAKNNSDKEAVVVCLVTLAQRLGITGIDEATASTGYDLYALVYVPAVEAGKTEAEAKALTVVAAIKTKYADPEGLAEAVYAVYKGTATKEQEKLAYNSLMVGAGIPANVAEALCECYINELDGQFNNDYVRTTMVFFMTQALGMTAQEAAENYDSYLTYKNLPTTLSKIAKVDTIYFDALLSATAGGNLNLSKVAEEFMAGTLVLEKPAVSEAEDPAAWAEYKSDSALATLFFRFMSQDGIYTHPSEAGQKTLFNAAKAVLDSLLTAEPDREIAVTADSKVLVLGDFIAANEDSYVSALAGKVTNLSNADFRINEIRALLDGTYSRDEYAQTVLNSIKDDYVKAVQDTDVVIVNLGSMNMGLIAKQLGAYMADGSTYSMEFADVDNMKPRQLGATMDAFLANFSGAFGVDAIGALMLAFETYGYGFTTFADCLDNTIETIQALNPQADIVLVGMYDLMGDAYIHEPTSGMYLEMGHFIGHAVKLMNLHMENYAAMTDNVTYVDVTATQTNVPGAVNMMENGVEGIAAAFGNAVPTADGYAYMAQLINCTMGAHRVAGEITWSWAEDYSAATASHYCDLCGKDVTYEATVVSENSATCTEAGKLTYTATVQIGTATYEDALSFDSAVLGHDYSSIVTAPTCSEAGFTTHTCSRCSDSYTDSKTPAIGHSYSAPVWTWTKADEDFTATATFTCGNDCGTIKTVQATVEVAVQDSSCTQYGLITYTATAEFEGQTYSDVQTEKLTTLAKHNFGEWTQTLAPTCTEPGKEVRTCSACLSAEEREIPLLGHNYQSVVTAPTCTEQGYTTYTCDRCADSYVTDRVPSNGHSYGEDGKCHCGEIDPNAHPVCEYTVEESLSSGGTYMLKLGGVQVGTYTFTQVSGGWTIQAADGTYLAIENEALVNSENAFTWTYSNGAFSAVVETKSSNNWWGSFGNWWGSSSKQTYYLVASGNSISVSTANSNTRAAFYTTHSDLAHNFGSGVVVAPTCTEQGYTTHTCDRCGYSYTSNLVSAAGHSYTAVVTAPTCSEAGYTTYTCATCGDSYVDNYVDATGHDYVDGVCTNCGHDTNEPEIPVEPEGECVYLAEKSLTSGETYVLSLGGNQVGTYTFTQVSGGWTIQAADGTYLALENKTLTNRSNAFTWTYSGNQFSTTVEGGSSNNWFGNWWGSRNQTYYLVASGGSIAASTSSTGANAKFYQEVSGEHVYGNPVSENGAHVFTCVNCGNMKTVACSDANCELCHPAVKVNVSVAITSNSSGNNWWGGSFGNWWGSSAKTTYTAKITVNAEGTEVASVAYSTNGGSTWTEGSTFDSTSEITAFDIRVVGTNGVVYYFAYSNGTVTQIG